MKKVIIPILIILVTMTLLALFTNCKSIESGQDMKEESVEEVKNENGDEIAVFGGGCFWCVEAVFQQISGVKDVVSGYAGGTTEDPAYSEVCSGTTGHAEVVKITFDPQVVSYKQLLEVFFYVHDPTTPDKQGNDVGEQYRSIILFTEPDQEKTAREFIAGLEEGKVYTNPIVTIIEPLDKFYPAESYHQDYYENNSSQPYCQLAINPKIEKFQDKFADLLK